MALQTPEGADEIAAMCQAANVQLMDGTTFMHNPRVKEFESHLPSLGELKNFTSTFCWMGTVILPVNPGRLPVSRCTVC